MSTQSWLDCLSSSRLPSEAISKRPHSLLAARTTGPIPNPALALGRLDDSSVWLDTADARETSRLCDEISSPTTEVRLDNEDSIGCKLTRYPDNHNAYPDRFKRFIQLAKENGGEFNLAAANALYGQNAAESIANNDKLFFNSYTILVVVSRGLEVRYT